MWRSESTACHLLTLEGTLRALSRLVAAQRPFRQKENHTRTDSHTWARPRAQHLSAVRVVTPAFLPPFLSPSPPYFPVCHSRTCTAHVPVPRE